MRRTAAQHQADASECRSVQHAASKTLPPPATCLWIEPAVDSRNDVGHLQIETKEEGALRTMRPLAPDSVRCYHD